ncbi:MAG TPA: C40 family peptidase [Pyrinomonadaceae bacterium]|nr:C40 family peptidase [Pyrinomonadaceae bacterium]
MFLRRLFPCAVAACAVIFLISLSVNAQTGEPRDRQVFETARSFNGAKQPVLENEPVIAPTATEEVKRHNGLMPRGSLNLNRVERLLSVAVDQRLGARYSWGATGPYAFDCSGFVWSTFRSAGINFERSSARILWQRFLPASPDEEFDFGTLVFFSNLTHVGIVVDEEGFYHASRRHGVIYSRFTDYWLDRIDGFRRVPMMDQLAEE